MPDEIPILITAGLPGDETVNLRFPEIYRAEILSLLDEQGLEHGSILEASADVVLWIEAVAATPATVASIVAFYKVFTHRHQDKRVIIKRDGTEIIGYSSEDVERLLGESMKHSAQQAKLWTSMTRDSLKDD